MVFRTEILLLVDGKWHWLLCSTIQRFLRRLRACQFNKTAPSKGRRSADDGLPNFGAKYIWDFPPISTLFQDETKDWGAGCVLPVRLFVPWAVRLYVKPKARNRYKGTCSIRDAYGNRENSVFGCINYILSGTIMFTLSHNNSDTYILFVHLV